jgi:hypothetical protein
MYSAWTLSTDSSDELLAMVRAVHATAQTMLSADVKCQKRSSTKHSGSYLHSD